MPIKPRRIMMVIAAVGDQTRVNERIRAPARGDRQRRPARRHEYARRAGGEGPAWTW
ncbi:MAG: hypothetical protein ACLT8E_11015 [Akkermansia sp.]